MEANHTGAAGVPVPEGLDGKSFAGLMRGASKGALQLREYIHGQTNHINYRYFGNYASPAGGTLPGITPPPLSNAARELHDRRNSEYLSSAYDRPVFLAGPKGYINHL